MAEGNRLKGAVARAAGPSRPVMLTTDLGLTDSYQATVIAQAKMAAPGPVHDRKLAESGEPTA